MDVDGLAAVIGQEVGRVPDGRYPVVVSIGEDEVGDEVFDDVVSAGVEEWNGVRRLVLRVAGGVFAPLVVRE